MGVSDALALMPRFDGNESNVIWPEWRLDLKQRVTFEFVKVGVNIINGNIDQDCLDDGCRLPGTGSMLNTDNNSIQYILIITLPGTLHFPYDKTIKCGS